MLRNGLKLPFHVLQLMVEFLELGRGRSNVLMGIVVGILFLNPGDFEEPIVSNFGSVGHGLFVAVANSGGLLLTLVATTTLVGSAGVIIVVIGRVGSAGRSSCVGSSAIIFR